jgi:hypothetical protein
MSKKSLRVDDDIEEEHLDDDEVEARRAHKVSQAHAEAKSCAPFLLQFS